MSLSEAVLAVAEAMEQQCKEDSSGTSIGTACLRSYARELRTAVKAAGSSPDEAVNPAFANFQMIQAERAKLRALRDAEEQHALRSDGPARGAVCRGGPHDGITVPELPAGMPSGASIEIAGAVYTLDAQGELMYDEKQTKGIE